MIKKLMMLCVAAMAAMGVWADPKFGFWVEMHDVPAETCSCIEHRIGKNHYVMTRLGAIEGGKGQSVAIPVYGLDSKLRDKDVFVTAGTYKDAGSPFVWTEEKMWTEYGQYFARAYESGDMYEDIWDDDDIHWADDCDSEFSPQILDRDYWSGDAKSVLYFMSDSGPVYELVSGIWDDWKPVLGRQWIIVPTPKASSVGKSGKITSFCVTIKVGSQYYSHIVEGVKGTSLKKYKSSNDMATVGAVSVPFNAGTVSGNGEYKNDSTVTLKAKASKGYVFSHWEGSLGDEIDSRSPSISFVVGENDVEFVAHFVSISESLDITLQESYGPYVPGAEVEVNLGLVGYTAKKLPSGLKLDKKTGIVKGKAKKPGVYQVTFTKKGAETLTAKFIVGPMPTITITMEGDTEKCKVTGASKPGKGYLVGKKVSLSAKGPKGTAFTGWFKDGEPWPNETEYLGSKLKYVMTEENLSLVARFEKEKMSVACDRLSTLTVGEEVLISIAIETQSGVKSVKGSKLPSGLKIKKDKATGEWFVTGKPKKKGSWNATITVTAKSGAVEKLPVMVTVEDKGEVDLPSANHYFREPLKNGEGEKYVVLVGISNVEDFLPNLKLTRGSLNVSGLPEGLKYDAASGKIAGIATKAGTYTVTLTVTDGKAKYVSTVTIEVEALPDWVVGTFDGWLQAIYEDSESDNLERIVIGITQVGKLSYKWYSQTDNDVMDEKDISLKKDIYGGYYITINEDWSDWKCDAVLEIKPLEIEGLLVGSIEGGGEGFEKEDGVWYKLFCSVQARQDCWIKAQDTIFSPKFVKGAITLIGMNDMRDWIWDDGYGGYLTLKYGANGAVTTAYSETVGGKATATGSAQLVPYEVDGNITKAWLYTALKPKGRDAFGVLLFLSIDTSNGNVYGDDVVVEDYLLED